VKTFLYSIYDLVAKTYSPPYVAQSDALAIRAVLTVLRDPASSLYQHPHDYRLFKLAAWDDENGEITVDLPSLIINIIDLVQKESSK